MNVTTAWSEDGRPRTVTRAILELTTMLSADVFDECGMDVTPLRSIVHRMKTETAYLKAIGMK
jgi:hypothetical protein